MVKFALALIFVVIQVHYKKFYSGCLKSMNSADFGLSGSQAPKPYTLQGQATVLALQHSTLNLIALCEVSALISEACPH